MSTLSDEADLDIYLVYIIHRHNLAAKTEPREVECYSYFFEADAINHIINNPLEGYGIWSIIKWQISSKYSTEEVEKWVQDFTANLPKGY